MPSLGQEDPLEKGKAPHSSILAWRILWTEGSWQALVHEITKELDTTERLKHKHTHTHTHTHTLVVQRLGIHLAMEAMQVQFLVRELTAHMPQGNWAQHHNERVHAPQQKVPHAVTKTQCSQINKY